MGAEYLIVQHRMRVSPTFQARPQRLKMAGIPDTCVEDLDCPGNYECYGTSCHCHTYYGWRGEDCMKAGTQTYTLYTVAGITILVALVLLFLSVRALKKFLARDLGGNKNIRQQSILISIGTCTVRKNNLKQHISILLHAQVMLLLCMGVSEVLTATIAANPEYYGDVILDNDTKASPESYPRDYFAGFWISIWYLSLLQLSTFWLSIGLNASLQPKDKTFFVRCRRIIRFIQFVVPVTTMLIILSSSNSLLIVAMVLPLYFIGSIIFWFAKAKFSAVLETSGSKKLKHHAKVLQIAGAKLLFMFTLLFCAALVVFVFLFMVEPTDYGFVLSKEGEINPMFTGFQVLRNTAGLYSVYILLDYFEAARKEPKTNPTPTSNKQTKNLISSPDL